uniref:RNA-directed DNA polymerase, eukaryota n=1 Tax=Tanacetum cinerariifolium TaxID=118510 RepID=A0A699KB43_TANCI|nr:RNA-directed DNA polymerase, eukaryota [Tanacetum cinerariifolium]
MAGKRLIYKRDSGKNNYQRLNKGTNVSNGGGIKNGGGLNSSANSYANVVKKPTGVKETIDDTPTMVLDESCLNNEEFSLCLLGKTCWVRAIEVPGWMSDFEDDCDDDDFNKPQSKDPFGVYMLLNKKKKVTNNEGESQNSPTYPPGFTPNDNAEDNINTSNVEPVERGHNGDKEEGEFVVSQNQDRNDTDVDANESTCSGHFKKYNGPRTGGSIIQLIEDLVNVGQTMGYDMTGCMKNMENIIESLGRTLWDYLCFTICNWDGDVVTMGDFNEVRDSSEIFGSVFNKHGAKLFNDFIAKAGLTEVPLGGYIFTWCHKTASKMSKLDRFLVSDSLLCNCPRISSVTLDRYLSDHRPILLRESIYDYGPVPFKFYHYWFEIDGFDKLVEDSWNEIHVVDNNAYMRFMKKLKLLKERIKAWNSSYRELTNCRKNTLKTELTNLDSTLDR